MAQSYDRALRWVADHAKERAPVFTEAEVPTDVLAALDRSDLVVRIPGGVVVLISPGDDPVGAIRAVVWQIVERLTAAYAPAVVERDSAVRLHLGRTDPGPEIRIRQTGRTRWRKEIAPGIIIRVERGSVPTPTLLEVGETRIPVEPAENVVLSLPVSFLKGDGLKDIAIWLKSLVLARPAVIEAYREKPRPVVLKRIEDIARDVGNERLADLLAGVLASEQNVRIGRDRTGVGREIVVPQQVASFQTTHQPWLDRLAVMIDESITQAAPLIRKQAESEQHQSVTALLEHARSAKAYDAYHSSSIEGYRLRYDEVENLLRGTPGGPKIEDVASRLAIVGYSTAFDRLLERVAADGRELKLSGRLAMGTYSDLFTPSVEAGIVEARSLQSWRNAPVYIRDTLYVPPNPDKVSAMIDLLFDRLSAIPVEEGLLRGIIAHLWFVWIHPFVDGNGRVARFLMNAAFLASGMRWLTIRVDQRDSYFQALRHAQMDGDYEPFVRFIVDSRAHAASTEQK